MKTKLECKEHIGYQPELLDVGDLIVAETHGGRRLVGSVESVETEDFMRKNPYHVLWTDLNGKHHEWFGLQEFKILIVL